MNFNKSSSSSDPRSASNNQEYILSLSPNPANETLIIHGITTEIIKEISVISINGNIRQKLKIDQKDTIHIDHLSQGVYVLHVTLQTGEVMTNKFIKL